MEVSFQLSFAAVLSLIAFYEWAYKRYKEFFFKTGLFQKLAIYFIGLSITTIIASVATAPLTLYHFQHFAMYSNLSNLVAVPLVSFLIMPFGVIALCLMPFGLEGAIYPVIEQAIIWVIDNAFYVAALEGAVAHAPQIPSLSITVFIFGAIVLLLTNAPFKHLSWGIMIVGIILGFQIKQADLLLSDNAKLIGFYDTQENRLSVNTIRSERYVSENWARVYGLKKEDLEIINACQQGACHDVIKGKTIMYLGQYDMLAEACEHADILILQFKLSPWKRKQDCAKPSTIVDRIDVWKEGSYAFFIDEGEEDIKIMTSKALSGVRPWSQ